MEIKSSDTDFRLESESEIHRYTDINTCYMILVCLLVCDVPLQSS